MRFDYKPVFLPEKTAGSPHVFTALPAIKSENIKKKVHFPVFGLYYVMVWSISYQGFHPVRGGCFPLMTAGKNLPVKNFLT
ncbi:MAG: hypothetical protein AB2L13_15655 [Spirochaetota bacterium]|jgi:hypothetical protein